MESAKCAPELGKIIKYSKNLQENEENLAIFTVILMAGFGTKNVHSAMKRVQFLFRTYSRTCNSKA